MKEVRLTKGKVAFVDDADYPLVSSLKWHAEWAETSQTWYALHNLPKKKGALHKRISMHRFLAATPELPQVDHKDGNGLDNRRENLRPCSRSQNQANRRKQVNNTSGHPGVHWHKAGQKWQAFVTHNGVRKHLGLFAQKKDAIAARDATAKELFGKFFKQV